MSYFLKIITHDGGDEVITHFLGRWHLFSHYHDLISLSLNLKQTNKALLFCLVETGFHTKSTQAKHAALLRWSYATHKGVFVFIFKFLILLRQ